MPFQPTVSGGGQTPVGSTVWGPAPHARSHSDIEVRASVAELAARSAAPPEALRNAILRAGATERSAILLQVSWLTHVLAQEAGAWDRRASAERLCVRADAARGDLPFERGALKRAWHTRFPHLLQGTHASDMARDMVAWCSARRDQTSLAARWHWLSAEDDASLDVSAFVRLPMREWPAHLLSVALTLSNLRDAILPDLSLSSADLRGLSAPGARFCGGQFNGAAWSYALLRGAGFGFSSQVNADFERADLRGAQFRAADLSGARLVHADIRGAMFPHAVMTGADLSSARCQGVTFEKVRLDNGALNQARMHGACFMNGSARGLILAGARAKHSQWTTWTMRNGRAAGADLRDAVFRECDLVGWDARGAKLNGAHFVSCDMRSAKFGGASLKRVRIGPGCDLGGTQWQDARLQLDAPWLRQLAPAELDRVVESWMTFPVDQPAMRVNVFLQLLGALRRRPVTASHAPTTAPSLHRLPEHVRRSHWLGRLLVAPSELGGLAAHEAFAGLRTQWVTGKLVALAEVRMARDEARWAASALTTELHGRCASASAETIRAHAGALCQTLYWAGDEVSGVADARVRALRVAWLEALPPQVHVALSADGIDALDAEYLVLTRADGDVAARLPRSLFASVLGSGAVDPPKEGETVFAGDPLPGWRWVGARVVVRDEASPETFVPGTMRQLQGLVREFGFLAGLWPVVRPLDAFVRLVGRWLGEDAAVRASAACCGIACPVEDARGTTPRQLPQLSFSSLSLADRMEAVVSVSSSSWPMKLRPAAHADIEEVFREFPVFDPETETPLSLPATRRVRLVSLAAGLSWLATQPEWHCALPSISAGGEALEPTRLACRRYACVALDEATTRDASWRLLPQVKALRACLADESSSSGQLAQRLAAWLTCADVRGLPGFAQACSQTLPWFWAIRSPLPVKDVCDAVKAGPLPAAAQAVG